MNTYVPAREKWLALLAGENVGPMVSPLCDNWALDHPYHWPDDDGEKEAFPPGHPHHALTEQIAMAKLCGWDPTFLAGVSCVPRNAAAAPDITSEAIDGGTRTRTLINTPYGPLESVIEHKQTNHVIKRELDSEDDYRKKAWVLQQHIDHDVDRAIAEGQELRRAVGEHGVLGTWSGPAFPVIDRDNMFYHLMDWPDACGELIAVNREFLRQRLDVLRAAGFDYLFYCVDGTEWISPAIFREHLLGEIVETFRYWREELGGFILWHSCGHVKQFISEGFYNVCKPDIFETLSEPPVGNLPSLRWAREHLDQDIITKGNMPLNILLQGTPDEVRQDVLRIKAETAGHRHIIGLSDDVLANTPLANARAFVDAARAV